MSSESFSKITLNVVLMALSSQVCSPEPSARGVQAPRVT